jgi:hypothetical protein
MIGYYLYVEEEKETISYCSDTVLYFIKKSKRTKFKKTYRSDNNFMPVTAISFLLQATHWTPLCVR